ALTHLVDTSVLTRLHSPDIRAVIEPKLLRRELGRASISDLEIGFAARDEREWDSLAKSLGTFALIETASEHVRRALQVQRLLARRHQRGRKLPDLLIAAAAELRGLSVLHYDADFDRIAAVTGQPTDWVVTAGTVD
ncbi:MAG TPA: PIN domain-containing protein, partial [Kofleriaceae bacterium]|nr:PIN domain-containing protein [Kofleriaceae bacterium]